MVAVTSCGPSTPQTRHRPAPATRHRGLSAAGIASGCREAKGEHHRRIGTAKQCWQCRTAKRRLHPVPGWHSSPGHHAAPIAHPEGCGRPVVAFTAPTGCARQGHVFGKHRNRQRRQARRTMGAGQRFSSNNQSVDTSNGCRYSWRRRCCHLMGLPTYHARRTCGARCRRAAPMAAHPAALARSVMVAHDDGFGRVMKALPGGLRNRPWRISAVAPSRRCIVAVPERAPGG